MHIIVGGTGQVGSAVAKTLLVQGQEVAVITREISKGAQLQAAGASVLAIDIRDVAALRAAFQTGKRAFLLNPSASPAGDMEAEERASIAAIAQALEGSGLEKVVATSTYGAHSGQHCGDLTVLHEFEQILKAQPIPCVINRGGYYMSNWTGAGMIEAVCRTGKLPSFLPADLPIPMVAPRDLGIVAAQRMMEPLDNTKLQYVEGPQSYSAQDVANAYAEVLKTPVEVAVIPPDGWTSAYLQLGFSEVSAESFANMTRKLVDGLCEPGDVPVRGQTPLAEFITKAVKNAGKSNL
ncbi:NmrA family NAD(P)-binding protein [Alcaligenes parafaecalis]|uniref:NmrA family NAD(P)-binding protein n=1 Tax=Alcaligenes parafaecalis TaxID=171260 RepID=A0ABT3VI53_9BURK|nr:NmrA family NAD(P)-binding protein [Alcaligenes parafaecalis]MCX5463177.1 NmrA family NAD(P)-binding protein [Alcaligenes parafaecalis]